MTLLLIKEKEWNRRVMSGHKGHLRKGRSVAIALKASEAAVENIEEMDKAVEHMNPKQEKLFKAMLSGYSDLECAIIAGYHSWFTGIRHKVLGKDGEPILTKGITLDQAAMLDEASSELLNNICRKKIMWITAEEDYRKYVDPVKEYFKRLAPRAAMTVNGIMNDNSVKPETRLKAAQDVLDRAGESAAPQKDDVVIPVLVQINLTEHDGSIRTIHGSN